MFLFMNNSFYMDVLQTISFFRSFCVVEAFQTSDEVSGNPSDTLEVDTFSHNGLHIFSSADNLPQFRRELSAFAFRQV